ncbi:hypothetical protein BMS3Abin12_01101 [bacterium BMS3Abin12]|nr:hypothetical protein BMS3Abin12_01101 [bacterium BMS3Abin12]
MRGRPPDFATLHPGYGLELYVRAVLLRPFEFQPTHAPARLEPAPAIAYHAGPPPRSRTPALGDRTFRSLKGQAREA